MHAFEVTEGPNYYPPPPNLTCGFSYFPLLLLIFGSSYLIISIWEKTVV